MATATRRVAVASASKAGIAVLHIAIAFGMTPLIITSLGDRHFGFWILIGALSGYYGLLDFGLRSAISRYASGAIDRDDQTALDNIASTGMKLFLLVAAVTVAIAAIASGSYLILSPSTPENTIFAWTIILLGMQIALSFPGKVLSGLLEAKLRHDLVSVAECFRLIISAIAIFIGMKLGYGLLFLACVSLGTRILELIVQYGFFRKELPRVSLHKNLSKPEVRRLFSFGTKSFADKIAVLLRYNLDNAIAAKFLGLAAVTPLGLGARLTHTVRALLDPAIWATSPAFARLAQRKDRTELLQRFKTVTTLSTTVAVYVSLSLLFYGQDFIAVWVGENYVSAYTVTLILTPAAMLVLAQAPAIIVLYGLNRHGKLAAIHIAESAANVILSMILVQHYGINGIAAGTTIPLLLVQIIALPYAFCKETGMTMRQYYSDLIGTMLKTASIMGIYFLFIHQLLAASLLTLTLLNLMQIAMIGPLIYAWLLGKPERNMLKKAISR